MFDGNRVLIEEYTRLKSIEKSLELNLGVLEELENLLLDNLEELEGYMVLLDGEKRLAAEKLKASISTILHHIRFMYDRLEELWEELEFAILKMAVHRTVPPGGLVDLSPIEEISERLALLKEYIDLQCQLLEDKFQLTELRKKFPAEVYKNFLDKLGEFNKTVWR